MRRFVAPKHYSGRSSRRVKASKQWPSTRPSWMRCVKKPRACESCDWLATPQRGQRPVRRVRRSLSIFRVSDNPLALANEVIELKRRKFITLLGGAAVARGRSQGRASAPIERSFTFHQRYRYPPFSAASLIMYGFGAIVGGHLGNALTRKRSLMNIRQACASGSAGSLPPRF